MDGAQKQYIAHGLQHQRTHVASELSGSVGNSESDRESMGKSRSSSLLMQSSQIAEQSIEAKRN